MDLFTQSGINVNSSFQRSTRIDNEISKLEKERSDITRALDGRNSDDLKKLDEKISQLKDGVNTRVGERGVNLSGGQIQRIGIARALYHEPKLLILDESTNAIEKDIEEKVVSYLSTIKKDKIIIIAAHRESAFKFCDKVFELKSGKI